MGFRNLQEKLENMYSHLCKGKFWVTKIKHTYNNISVILKAKELISAEALGTASIFFMYPKAKLNFTFLLTNYLKIDSSSPENPV